MKEGNPFKIFHKDNINPFHEDEMVFDEGRGIFGKKAALHAATDTDYVCSNGRAYDFNNPYDLADYLSEYDIGS